MTVPDLTEQLLKLPDVEAQKRFLQEYTSLLDDAVANGLKGQADRFLRTAVQRSLETAELLVYMTELTGNPLYRALGLLAEANARSIGGLGEYQRAVELYDCAAAIYQAHGLPAEQANAQVGKVFSLALLGRYQEAQEAGEWASVILEQHEQWRQLITLTMNLAIAYGRQRQDAKALAQLDRARELCRRLGPEGIATLQLIENNRAIVLRNLGQFRASMEASRATRELAEQLGHKFEMARAREELAYTYLLQGRYNEALELLNQARDIFTADGRHSDAIKTELVITNCLLQLRRFRDVLDKCHRLHSVFAVQGTRREMADVILSEAMACAGLQRYDEALDLLAQARDIFAQEGNHVRVTCTDMEMAAVLYRQNRLEESLETAQACASAFQVHDLPVQQAEAYLISGRAATALKRFELAHQVVRQALTVGEAKDMPSLVYPCRHLLGTLAQARGDPQEALAEYDRAIEELERLRGRLMIEFRAGFLEDKQVVYEDAVALTLDLGQPPKSLEYAERAKSRALLDLLAYSLDLGIHAREDRDRALVEELTHLRAERDRLYRRWETNQGLAVRGWAPGTGSQGDLTSHVRQDVLALEKRIEELWHTLLIRNADYARDASLWQVRTEPIQPHLGPETLLLEYFIARGRLVAFTVTAAEVQARRLSVNLAQVQRLVQLLWLNLRAVPMGDSSRAASLAVNAQGILGQLYDQLVAPLQDQLEAYPQLIVVPHGPLHYLPFHALYDGQSYLLEQHTISYLPVASLLSYRPENSPARGKALALGHSYGGALPHAVQEARSIATILDGQAMLEGQATLAQFEQMAPDSRILHLATHGDFRPDTPLFSGLALSDGWLTTLDIFNLSLKASLVTLSACQTGRNVVGGGDELLGLMRAFLYAGAASLVLSLWAVEDRSTARLMETFYRKLAEGWTKGAALQHAQRQFIAERSAEQDALSASYAHPYFWAPFFLVGDTGTL
jgi:CHAT domain-containing protein